MHEAVTYGALAWFAIIFLGAVGVLAALVFILEIFASGFDH